MVYILVNEITQYCPFGNSNIEIKQVKKILKNKWHWKKTFCKIKKNADRPTHKNLGHVPGNTTFFF